MEYSQVIERIKESLIELESEKLKIRNMQATDLKASMTPEKWSAWVDKISEFDIIRNKKIPSGNHWDDEKFSEMCRHITSANHISSNAKQFYESLKKIGPCIFTKKSQNDLLKKFQKKSDKINNNYQTFYNGMPADVYGISDSFRLIKDSSGMRYAYLPDLEAWNKIESSLKSGEFNNSIYEKDLNNLHFSKMYLPKNNSLFCWYFISPGVKYEAKHPAEYYDNLISEANDKMMKKLSESIEYINDYYINLRKEYPLLEDYELGMENEDKYVVDKIVYGKCRLNLGDKEIVIPQLIDFPFKSSMTFDKKDLSKIHALYLTLLYSLPLGKVKFTFFDPIGLGENVNCFNEMYSNELVVPAKKVIYEKKDLEQEIKNVMEEIQYMRQNLFTGECDDWVSYNKMMAVKNPKETLPYRVFTFFDMPNEMDETIINQIKTMMHHSKECGYLILFSYEGFEGEHLKAKWELLDECIEIAKYIDNVLGVVGDSTNEIKAVFDTPITFEEENAPEDSKLKMLVNDYLERVIVVYKRRFSYSGIIGVDHLYDQKSLRGLEFGIGIDAFSGAEVKIYVNDDVTHYLIGGQTGSGKSNLLNNLIMSSCARYSPDELQVYLLDFKQGVEFSKYANPLLPHARLVATSADTEYGVKVLEHLTKEMKMRYDLIKKSGVSNIAEWRDKNPDKVMPRILVVIDEFQVLFENKEKNQTIENLNTLAKQGRGGGIHLIMATQSLSGVEFGTLASQFGGRIALKSTYEDSVKVLGGTGSNNDAAAKIDKPYAIINTAQGAKSANIKVGIARADDDILRESVSKMIEAADGNVVENPVIFEGQKMPYHPEVSEYATDKKSFLVGKIFEFEARPFLIKLRNKVGNNIACCGSSDDNSEIIKYGLIKSFILSMKGSSALDEFVYIGEDEEILYWEDEENNIFCFDSVKAFLDFAGEEMFDKNRIVIFDDCNLVREVDYPTGYGAVPKDDAEKVIRFIKDAALNGSVCVAMFSRARYIKEYKIPMDDFENRVGYELSEDDARSFIGNQTLSNIHKKSGRCFFSKNGEVVNWFQPYVLNADE